MTDTETATDGIAALRKRRIPPGSPDLGDAYESMIREARRFIDQLALARIDIDTAGELRGVFESWTNRLRRFEVRDDERLFGRWIDREGCGQFLVPSVRITDSGDDHLAGLVTFGAFHLGGNGAAHGGAMMLVFDDILGYLAGSAERVPSRTAYLKIDFRSVAPVGEELDLRCWIDRIEGRKRFMRGELRRGDTLCAEAEGLWVELRPGQP